MASVDFLKELKKIASDERRISAINDVLRERHEPNKIEEFATIVPGIMGKQQIAIARGLSNTSVSDDGCGGSCVTPQQEFITQEWDPRRIKMCMKFCYTDLEGSFTQWAQNKGNSVTDLTGIDYMKWFEFFIRQRRDGDLIGQVLFGNANMEDSLLREVGLKKFYTTIDKGLLPTLQYFKTLEAFKDQFIKIDKNDAATLKEQMSLDKEYAMGIFEKMEEKGYNVPDGAQFTTSDSLFRNYTKGFSTQGPSLESVQRNIQEGIASSKYSGIPIIKIRSYDQIVRKDFFTKDKVYVPHFALLCHKSNILVGVDSAAALEDLTFEYAGGSDEHFYVKGRYRLDVKIANPLEIVAAF